MKRFICVLMMISLLPMLLACAENNLESSSEEEKMEFNAIILEIENDSILVDSKNELFFGEYRVNVGEITKYYDKNGKEASKSDLKEGDTITVSHNGQVARSLPPQVYALKITLQ